MNPHIIDAKDIIPRQSISVRFDAKKQIVHIGLHLVFNDLNDPYEEVYNYAERTLLYYALLSDKDKITKKMDEEQVLLKYNEQILPANRIKTVLSSIQIDQDTKLRLDSNKDSFLASWQLNNTALLQIGFPNDYSVISGKQKDEIELEIMDALQAHVIQSVETDKISRIVLEPAHDELFVKRGKTLLDHPHINSDRYYVRNSDGSFKPVFSQKYFRESTANIFQNLISTDQKIVITHKLYGNQEEHFTLDLNCFLNFFSENYTTYFGWQRDLSDDLVASIFVKNKVFNFIHLLIIKTNSNLIINNNSTLEGTLYTFIPQNQISL
ncbi:MAG: hypothetical protein NTV01_17825 [Bacteroidia bacterium]|nr:hypothetical protein [Bacteroidia bacterium]